MGANGKNFGEQVLDRVARAWDETVRIVSRQPEAAPEPKPLVTRVDRQLAAIRPWARQAPPEFFDWLNELLTQTRSERRLSVESHGRLANLTGFEDALATLKAQFHDWCGTSPSAPTQGE